MTTAILHDQASSKRSTIEVVFTYQVLALHWHLNKSTRDALSEMCCSNSADSQRSFFLPLKKNRIGDPLSLPNKVFASSQMSPTSSSTAMALRGAVIQNIPEV